MAGVGGAGVTHIPAGLLVRASEKVLPTAGAVVGTIHLSVAVVVCISSGVAHVLVTRVGVFLTPRLVSVRVVVGLLAGAQVVCTSSNADVERRLGRTARIRITCIEVLDARVAPWASVVVAGAVARDFSSFATLHQAARTTFTLAFARISREGRVSTAANIQKSHLSGALSRVQRHTVEGGPAGGNKLVPGAALGIPGPDPAGVEVAPRFADLVSFQFTLCAQPHAGRPAEVVRILKCGRGRALLTKRLVHKDVRQSTDSVIRASGRIQA
jgi:hypothetical protein